MGKKSTSATKRASETSGDAALQAKKVLRSLKTLYPDVRCELDYETPVQLLVATILSAQCTDQRVNLVTAELFKTHATAEALASMPLSLLEQKVQSTGFFRNKAKNIKEACCKLVDLYGGEIPPDLDALIALPGVGRKTANVVLGTAFRIPTGVVVDTHVTRLSNRLGLTRHQSAEKIELDLMALIPKKEWIDFSHRLIIHGRRVCNARKPKCTACAMATFCPQIGVESYS